MPTYETEIVAPPYFDSPEDAEFLIDQIREVAWPVIVARFEVDNINEAHEHVEEINHTLRSRGLPQFPHIKMCRKRTRG